MATPGNLIGFVPVTDAERATGFYCDTLGLEFLKDDGFAIVLKSGDNMVRLAKLPSVTPTAMTVLGWETTSIESSVRALIAKGVVFSCFPYLQQNELGIWKAPGGDKVAWFTDPDGNVLSLSQHL